jgi:hypothetical protein
MSTLRAAREYWSIRTRAIACCKTNPWREAYMKIGVYVLALAPFSSLAAPRRPTTVTTTTTTQDVTTTGPATRPQGYGPGYAGNGPYGPVTRVAHTDPVMPVPLAMSPPQAPSRSRLAIGRIILAVRVITWAALITSGGQDIGHGAAVKESGFTAITL